MGIFEAYFTHARVFAVMHAVFLLICIAVWVVELLRLKSESDDYGLLRATNFTPVPNSNSEIVSLTVLALALARKGEVISPEILRLRLTRSIARHDMIIRACINGLIISGLLGTLYNLWKLGPDFFKDLIQGQVETAQPAIGIAFTASIFGLSTALILMLIDSFIIRFLRDAFVRQSVNTLFDCSTNALPPKEGAAVAQALQNFYDASKGFLEKLRGNHEELSRQFTKQVFDSSGQLINTLNDVGGQWRKLSEEATSSIKDTWNSLKAEVNTLNASTRESGKILSQALSLLSEANKANTSIIGIRAETESLRNQITQRLEAFSDKWRQDINNLTLSHVQRMEAAYKTGWEKYRAEADHWHSQNFQALETFSQRVENGVSEWDKERYKLSEYMGNLISVWEEETRQTLSSFRSKFDQGQLLVDDLIKSWRTELGTNITTIQGGLGQLTEQVSGLQTAASNLSSVYSTADQQLSGLKNAIGSLSTNIANGTPIGDAIKSMTEAVMDFKNSIHKNGNSEIRAVSTNDAMIPPQAFAELSAMVQGIADSTKNLQASVARIASRETYYNPNKESKQKQQKAQSKWRIVRLFKRLTGKAKND